MQRKNGNKIICDRDITFLLIMNGCENIFENVFK